MKQLKDFTDAEKIKAFESIYHDLYDAFNDLTTPINDNFDHFDPQQILEGMIEDNLMITQEEWDKAIQDNR